MSQGTTLASTLNRTPEQERKWETNREICRTVYMVSQSNLEVSLLYVCLAKILQPWHKSCVRYPQCVSGSLNLNLKTRT